MARQKAEPRVYTEFLTNVAVAWFAAGIIAPLFNPPKTLSETTASMIAIIGCLASLRIAVLLNKGGL